MIDLLNSEKYGMYILVHDNYKVYSFEFTVRLKWKSRERERERREREGGEIHFVIMIIESLETQNH